MESFEDVFSYKCTKDDIGVGRERSGGAMVLDKLPVTGRPTNMDSIRTRLTALAVGTGEVVWTFFSYLSFLSSFSLSLSPRRRSDID